MRPAPGARHLPLRLVGRLGGAGPGPSAGLHRAGRRGGRGPVRRVHRDLGPEVPGDHRSVAQCVGGVHSFPRLRHRDTKGHLLDERDREPQRPLPARGEGPRPFPDRAGSAQVSLPGDLVTGPDRTRQGTMDHPVEAGAERVRDHLRRQNVPQQHQPEMTGYTVRRTDPPDPLATTARTDSGDLGEDRGMATKDVEAVVGAPVLADASVMTRDARARMRAKQLGPPLGALVKMLNRRRQVKAEKNGADLGPSSGPDACTLAVTEAELVAVQTTPGWNSMKAVSALVRIPRTSIVGARIEPVRAPAPMVITFADNTQWVFEVLGGVPRRRCEEVLAALGF